MIKQFLLNQDWSVPPHVDVELLKQQGIPLVVPTPMPRESGMEAYEDEPQMVDGILHQVWKLRPIEQPAQLPE